MNSVTKRCRRVETQITALAFLLDPDCQDDKATALSAKDLQRRVPRIGR